MSERRALLIVDVQPTFCEGGELPVPGGDAVAESIGRYLRARRGDYALTATSQDWHIDPADHFSDSPDFIDTWPPHGLAGSANAELHPLLIAALGASGADVSVKKGQHAAAYSAFEGVDEDGRTLAERLDGRGNKRHRCVRHRGIALRPSKRAPGVAVGLSGSAARGTHGACHRRKRRCRPRRDTRSGR